MSYSMKVIEAIQSEELNEIETLIEQALKHDSSDDIYLLADSLYQLGFLEETKTVLNHLLDLFPTDDELRINLAEIAIEEGKDLVAIDYLDAISEDSPAYVQSLLVLADYYQTQQLPEVSVSKLKEAKRLMPDEPIILFGLAELYYYLAEYHQAIHNYEECLRLGVNEMVGINIQARIGTAHSGAGDFEQAAHFLEEALKEKEDIDTLFNLGFTYYQLEEYGRAVECFKHVQSLDHTYTSIYPYLALALEEELREDEAIEVVEEGIRLDNTNTRLYLIGAKLQMKRGQVEEAEQLYNKAYELNPNSESTLIEMSNFFIEKGEYERAIELISTAMDDEQVDPQFYWILANAHNELEEFDEARQFFDKAYEHFEDNRYFLTDYITFLQEERRLDQLRAVIERYLEIDPSDDEMRELLLNLDME